MYLFRFSSLIFWLYADPSKLNPRLDDRVDKMIEVLLQFREREMGGYTYIHMVKTKSNNRNF